MYTIVFSLLVKLICSKEGKRDPTDKRILLNTTLKALKGAITKMKVEVKKIDTIKRELSFEISKERVSKKFEDVYRDIGKVAKVKGFRAGKVPKNILEAQFADTAQEEVVKAIIPEAYQEAIDKENILPIDMPEIHDVDFKDGIIKFKAKLEIKPDVKVKDYKGIKVKKKSSEVTEEELNKTLDYFKKGQGKEDVAIDDEFAKGLGYPSLEEFKKTLTDQMGTEKDRQNRTDIENQVVDFLLKKTKVLAPKTLTERQLVRRLEEWKNQVKTYNKMTDEEIKEKEEGVKKDLHQAIEKDIKVYLILDKIAQLEGIEVKQGENLPVKVMEFLLKEAVWS